MPFSAIDAHQPQTDTYELAAAAYDVKAARTPADQATLRGVDHAVVALPRHLLDGHGIGITVNTSR